MPTKPIAKPPTRTTPTPAPPSLFASNLRTARENVGLSIDKAAVYAQIRLHADSPSREMLRRLEDGRLSEDAADPAIIAALARTYGVDLAAISPLMAERLHHIYLLASDLYDASSSSSPSPSLKSRPGRPSVPELPEPLPLSRRVPRVLPPVSPDTHRSRVPNTRPSNRPGKGVKGPARSRPDARLLRWAA